MKKILIGYLIDGKNSGIDNYILNIIDQIKNDNVLIYLNVFECEFIPEI